jgi:Stigma-specific protein, Stig1
MIRIWHGLLGALVLGLAAPIAGCTSLLGDFSSTESAPEAGVEAGPTQPDATVGDDAIGSTDDGPSTPEDDGSAMADSSSGCSPHQMMCAAGCVSDDDIHNCGVCGRDCTVLPHVAAQGLTCTNGVCTATCAPGYKHCSSNPADVCETDLSEAPHCGDCNTACDADSGTPVCAATADSFACTSGCPAETTLCSGSCANLMTDDGHCGTCDNACTNGMTCQSGTCACPAPLTNCGGSCYETDGDPTHCGTSCAVCPVPPNGGTATCSQGSCGGTCAAGYSACTTGTQCQYNTNTDATHCGPACTACTGGMICSGGACSCPAADTNCSGTCVNPLTNANNCGGCGNVCPDTAPLCKGGACQCATLKCGTSTCPCGSSCCKVGATLGCC